MCFQLRLLSQIEPSRLLTWANYLSTRIGGLAHSVTKAVAVHVAVQLIEMVQKPFNGGAGGARTHDPRIMSPML